MNAKFPFHQKFNLKLAKTINKLSDECCQSMPKELSFVLEHILSALHLRRCAGQVEQKQRYEIQQNTMPVLLLVLC